MKKDEIRKKFLASLELKKQMLDELKDIQQSVQMELRTTGRIACL